MDKDQNIEPIEDPKSDLFDIKCKNRFLIISDKDFVFHFQIVINETLMLLSIPVLSCFWTHKIKYILR